MYVEGNSCVQFSRPSLQRDVDSEYRIVKWFRTNWELFLMSWNCDLYLAERMMCSQFFMVCLHVSSFREIRSSSVIVTMTLD